MITMDKQSLKTHVFLYIERLDEDSEQYERFCDIILTAMGVVNPDGTLSDDYAESDLWDGGDDGTPLSNRSSRKSNGTCSNRMNRKHSSSNERKELTQPSSIGRLFYCRDPDNTTERK